MKVERSGAVAASIGRLWGEGTLAAAPERDLLDRFLGRGDAAAFGAILDRHGPMVLGVCRAILLDPGTAEDAFQATFLVLVRRGRSIRHGEHLGAWLRGVARRVATRAEAIAARRRAREGGDPAALAMIPAPPAADPARRELVAVALAELDRLPAPERSAVTLCHLDGLTHQEAADRLGWPLGTVKSRVLRGRDRLRRRLVGRGVTLSAPALVAALTAEATASPVPAGLHGTTTRAALALLAGRAAGGSMTGWTLARGMARAPGLSASFAAGCLVAALLAVPAVVVVQAPPPRVPIPPAPPAAPLRQAIRPTPEAGPAAPGPIRFDRTVIDADFPGAARVEVADVDGDKKPDLVVGGGNTVAWYQNPTWTKRIIATGGDPVPGAIADSATVDLDGDGRAEVAIAADFTRDDPTRGRLFLASPGPTLDAPWTFRTVAAVPSIHRIAWCDVVGDGKLHLIVATQPKANATPPADNQDAARLVVYAPDRDRPKTGDWSPTEIFRGRAIHAFQVLYLSNPMLSNQKMSRLLCGTSDGVLTATPSRGRGQEVSTWRVTSKALFAAGIDPSRQSECGELHLGFADRQLFTVMVDIGSGSELVTWHKPDPPPPTQVVGRDPEAAAKRVIEIARGLGIGRTPRQPPVRTVVDATLGDPRGLWVDDIDGDHSSEIFIGDRGKDHGVAMYRRDGATWKRTVVDPAIAPEDLRGGDLDGDGRPDLVAVSGTSPNVVWYRPAR